MEQVYKINQIVINDTQSQFCIAYNNGIKNFSTEDFKEKYNSGLLGSITIVSLIHELNMVVFVGSENNELYNNKKIVIFDLINQKNIYSTSFQNEIKSLKVVSKYLIIGFQTELKIFSLEKKDNIIPIKEIALPESDSFEVWEKSSNDIISITKTYLIYPFQEEICITSFIGNEWNLEKKKDIKMPSKKIQNFFYVKKLNQLFVPDETAYYIYGIDPEEGKQKLCLYRGRNPGVITSVTLLNKNYLALNNLNRSIYIFDISNDNKGYNFSSLIGGFFYGDYISPFMKIQHNIIVSEKEGQFYEGDFLKKGAILASEEDGIELKVIAYNGYAYKLRINFLKKNFDLLTKEKFAVYKIDQNNEVLNEDIDSSLFNSYNSIFEKEKKNKDEQNFGIYH